MKIGQRLIMYRSSYTESGLKGHVCIGVIVSINDGMVGINQYGYDLKEHDYVLDCYVWGSYTLQQVREIISAQRFLRRQFKSVNIKKNPIDFYQSERNISEINNL